MTVDHFVASAEAAAPLIGRKGLAVGERIRLAVEATQRAVGRTPISASSCWPRPLPARRSNRRGGDLKSRLAPRPATAQRRGCARSLSGDPRGKARRAGRGAPRMRLPPTPEVTLLEAMRAAEARDRIAWNYAHDFADIFELGLDLAGAGARALERAVLGGDARLSRLSRPSARHPDRAEIRPADRHRGAGGGRADRGELHVMPVAGGHDGAADRVRPRLEGAPAQPGTSADLTVATLFAASLIGREGPK